MSYNFKISLIFKYNIYIYNTYFIIYGYIFTLHINIFFIYYIIYILFLIYTFQNYKFFYRNDII